MAATIAGSAWPCLALPGVSHWLCPGLPFPVNRSWSQPPRLYKATRRNSPLTDQSVDYSSCRLCKKQGLPFWGLCFFLVQPRHRIHRIVLLALAVSSSCVYIFLHLLTRFPPAVLQPLPQTGGAKGWVFHHGHRFLFFAAIGARRREAIDR